MSIASYSELKTDIASWLNRTDLTASIPGFIQLAEQRIYRELRVRQMETALSTAMSSGVIAVPTGYVAMKFAYVDGTPVQKLLRKDAEWIYHNYPTRSAEGKPQFFARDGSNLIFGPYPDSDYTVKGAYYKKLTALSDSNTTNWLTDDAPDLILFASLLQAAPYLANDSRIQVWDGLYTIAKNAIQRQDDAEEFSGSVLAMSSQ